MIRTTNGSKRVAFSPDIILTIFVLIFGGGIAWGTLLMTQMSMSKDLAAVKSLVEQKYYTKEQIEALNVQQAANLREVSNTATEALRLAKGGRR